FTTRPATERTILVLDALRDVMLPRLALDDPLANSALELIDDIEKSNVPIVAVLRALLKYRSESKSEVEAELRRSLLSKEKDLYSAGIRGLLFWLRTQRPGAEKPLGYDLTAPTADLLQQLGTNFSSRRQPGLYVTINAIAAVLATAPHAIDVVFRDSVRAGI